MTEGLVIAGLGVVIAGIIALETGFPAAVLELVMGMIIAAVFPEIREAEFLKVFGEFGLVAIMFFAGFEADIELIKKTYKISVKGGTMLFLVRFLVFLGLLLIMSLPLRRAAAMAIALSTSSVALIYPFLREKNLLNKEIGVYALASVMVMDILGMIALSIVLTKLSLMSLIIGVVTVLLLIAVPFIVPKLFEKYKGNLIELEVRIILLLIIALIPLSEAMGVSDILLAFILGLLASEAFKEHTKLEEKLKGVVFGLLAPIFFFYTGTLITFENPSQLGGIILEAGAYWLLFFLLNYILCKYIYKVKISGILAHLFSYKLSITLAAGLAGYRIGIITQRDFYVILFVVLISMIIPTIALRYRIEPEEMI